MPSQTHGKFIWCELMTTDMQAARDFYGKVTGWSAKSMPCRDGWLRIRHIRHPRGDEDCGVAGFMTIPPDMEGHVPPNWTAMWAWMMWTKPHGQFEVEGGSIRRPPQDMPRSGALPWLADPNGAVICIMTPQPMDNPPPMAPQGTPGTFGWHELYAGNGEEALAFYASCLAGRWITLSIWEDG